MSGTLNEQLEQIANTKNAIAQAINDKGVSVTSEDSFSSYATKIGEIQGSGSGETIIVQGGSSFNLFDTKLVDHILEGDEAKGWALQGTAVTKNDYPEFYERCLEEFNSSTLLDNIYTNDNGHRFYDISYKSTIDAEFEQTGMAWLYGIDQENEQIILPRNNFFEQASVANVGQTVEAGLPNIEGNIYSTRVDDGLGPATGAFKNSKHGTANVGFTNGTSGVWDDMVFDASQSNAIYGKSYTVQPNAVKKLLYICVGDTVVDESIIDLTKEIELNNPFFLGQSQYFENEPNNLSWLKSDGSYHNKEMYPSMFEYIKENIEKGTKDFKRINEEYDDYSYILDEENETFRLPLLNGTEDLPSDRYDNLILSDSHSTYTAPSNGWFTIKKYSSEINQDVCLVNNESGACFRCFSPVKVTACCASITAAKGDIVMCSYSAAGELSYFRFMYAKGNGSLYYFVGEAIQNANIVNIGKISATLSNKLDINLDNLTTDGMSSISGLSLPGERYIDLTLGTSGSTYTAPANGWVSFGKTTGSSGQYISLACVETGLSFLSQAINSGNNLRIYLPIVAGHTFKVSYNASGSTLVFRFVYAEGDK